MTAIVTRITDAFFTPVGLVVGIVVMFGLYGITTWFDLAVEAYISALSIFAISFSQMVGISSRRSEAAIHAKLNELVRVEPKASDELVGMEDKQEG